MSEVAEKRYGVEKALLEKALENLNSYTLVERKRHDMEAKGKGEMIGI